MYTILMSYLAGSCDCSGSEINPLPAQCYTCVWLDTATASEKEQIREQMKEAEQRRIWNTARVPSSLYTMNLGAMNVAGNDNNQPLAQYGNVNWNQMSDRAVPGVVNRHVPRQRTRAIPGQQSAGGKGVDVKHDSYARYLARKKAPVLKQKGSPSTPANPTPINGNKYYKLGLVAGCNLTFC